LVDQREDVVHKGAHCAWQIRYHIVLPVKYRQALPDEAVTAIMQETAAESADRFPIEMEAVGTDKNHIHLLCSAHPKMAPGRIGQIVKSSTAREIVRRKPAVKRERWGGAFGTDGYDVATVGERANWQTVDRYVRRQGPPAKIFDSSECVSSVIPRSLLRGASFEDLLWRNVPSRIPVVDTAGQSLHLEHHPEGIR
jgi:putative transposase